MQNAGACYVELGKYSQALPQLLDAMTLWEELGFQLETIRTGRRLATIHLKTGHLDAGIAKLEETYRALQALGVVNESSLARMEAAEALLAAGRPQTVPNLLRDVAFNFAAEGMMRNARIALAYLHEALASGRVSSDVVRHVRAYLEDLPAHPSARFSPLQ